MVMASLAWFAIVTLLAWRAWDIQVRPPERLQETVSVPISTSTIEAPRGAVLDRKGRRIAFSMSVPTIVADPRAVADPEAAAAALAPVLESPAEDILLRLRNGRAFSYLARQVSPDTGEQVSDMGLAGIRVIEEPGREHPDGDCSALAAVGRVNIDHVGMSGLEEAYNESLSGVPGRIVKEVGVDGTTIPGGTRRVTEAVAGSDLTLTLDRNIQYQTEQLLIRAVADAVAAAGVALVSLPGTGEIIAMANIARGTDGVVGCTRQNMAVTWSYEPGSVSKPITVAAALSSGAVTADEQLVVPSAVTLAGKRFEDTPWHDEMAWTLTDILTVSSNVGAITVAQMVGEEDLHDAVRLFGFGARTALDFKGESKGIVMPLDDWNKLTLPTVAIGQGMAVTPAQLLQAYNAIANDGVMEPLRLVADGGSIVAGGGADGTDGADADGADAGGGARGVRVMSAESAARLREMLVSVVEHGTGRRAALSGFTMAGKTGTAWQPCHRGYDCVNSRGELVGRHHSATFVGIVGNDSGPVMVVLVAIDDPKGPHISGGRLAAPVTKSIAEYALRQLKIPAISGAAPDQRHRAEPAPPSEAVEDAAADPGTVP